MSSHHPLLRSPIPFAPVLSVLLLSSAVQAQGFSTKAERSAHSAVTAVPPGQVLPAAHVVSV